MSDIALLARLIRDLRKRPDEKRERADHSGASRDNFTEWKQTTRGMMPSPGQNSQSSSTVRNGQSRQLNARLAAQEPQRMAREVPRCQQGTKDEIREWEMNNKDMFSILVLYLFHHVSGAAAASLLQFELRNGKCGDVRAAWETVVSKHENGSDQPMRSH